MTAAVRQHVSVYAAVLLMLGGVVAAAPADEAEERPVPYNMMRAAYDVEAVLDVLLAERPGGGTDEERKAARMELRETVSRAITAPTTVDGDVLIVTARPEQHRRAMELLLELREPAPDPARRPATRVDAGDAWQALSKPVSVTWRDTPFLDALQELTDQMGVELAWHRGPLELVGIDADNPPTDPVTRRFRDRPAAEVLASLFKVVDDEFDPVDYITQGDTLVITTEQGAGRITLPRVYHVGDLIDEAMTHEFGAAADPGNAEQRHDAVWKILDLIHMTIAPASWNAMGGRVGSISAFNDRFIIRTTPRYHWEIDQLLARLRSAPPDQPPTTPAAPGGAYRALSDRISVDWRQAPVGAALEELAEELGVVLAYDDRSLETVDFDVMETVTFSANHSYAAEILLAVLNAVSDPFEPLGYVTRGETLIITTEAAAGNTRIPRVYHVADLIGDVRTHGLGLDADANRRVDPARRLADIIRDTAAPNSWDVHGGVVGSIVVLNDRLLIRTTPQFHWEVEQLLARLRADIEQDAP